MVFQVLPPTGTEEFSVPLPLASQQTSSPLLELFVPGEAEKVFIRMIALFLDGEPLGLSSAPDLEDVPTFLIRAGTLGGPHGQGSFTPVGPGSEDVPILGGDNTQVGSLGCQHDRNNDIFLITIADIVENSGPWKLRIRNNAVDSLRFLGFSSHTERDTRQPWMRLGDPNTSFISSHLEFFGRHTRSIEVRNWGTAPLTFDDEPGPIGDTDSGLVLKKIPGRLDPHQVGVITVEATQDERRIETTHQLRCNDTIEAHAKLSFDVRSTRGGGGPFVPVEQGAACTQCDCPAFVGPPTGDICKRNTCGHKRINHPEPI